MIQQQAQRRTRRPLPWLRALLISLLIMSGTIVGAAGPAQAAMPAFQMPFPCGETWKASTYSGHPAIDWNAYPDDNGRTVVASAAGTASLYYEPLGGYQVIIDHGDGWKTVYAHLQQNGRVSGPVTAGQAIGLVGNTGGVYPNGQVITFSPHLHWEQIHNNVQQTTLYANGVALNPGSSADQTAPSYTSNNCGSTSHGLLAPSAITDPSTGRNIFYVGADGYIWQWSLQNGQWVNFKLTTPSGAQAVAPNTSPTAIYDPTSGRNVFYVGADKAIWQWSVQNGQWVNFRLGGSVASDSSPSAVMDPTTGRNVFYVGVNGSINQWSIQNNQWTNVSLGGTALGGTSPSAVVDPTTGRNVFYVGLDSKISQWSVQNGQWTNVALNGAGGNKTVASHSSPSAVVDTTTGRNIFYVGSDSFIYQWSVQNGQWTNFALTGTGGNQPAAQYSSPSAVVDPSTGRNIFYVGANGQIYQWSIQNSAWNNFMLTGAGGNAAVDSNTSPGAVIDTSTGTDRNIFYFNTGRVYQWSIQNNQWTNFQLQ